MKYLRKLPTLISIFIGIAAYSAAWAGNTPGGDKRHSEAARKVALETVTGKVEMSTYMNFQGHWVYAYEIRDAKGQLDMVVVAAESGKLVGHMQNGTWHPAKFKK